jgi:hypothetical protein
LTWRWISFSFRLRRSAARSALLSTTIG